MEEKLTFLWFPWISFLSPFPLFESLFLWFRDEQGSYHWETPQDKSCSREFEQRNQQSHRYSYFRLFSARLQEPPTGHHRSRYDLLFLREKQALNGSWSIQIINLFFYLIHLPSLLFIWLGQKLEYDLSKLHLLYANFNYQALDSLLSVVENSMNGLIAISRLNIGCGMTLSARKITIEKLKYALVLIALDFPLAQFTRQRCSSSTTSSRVTRVYDRAFCLLWV